MNSFTKFYSLCKIKHKVHSMPPPSVTQILKNQSNCAICKCNTNNLCKKCKQGMCEPCQVKVNEWYTALDGNDCVFCTSDLSTPTIKNRAQFD